MHTEFLDLRISLFLTVFLSLYSLLHFYAFLKARAAFSSNKVFLLCLALFMIFMIFCPIIVRVLERDGMERLPEILAHVGYTWMGFLFLFVCSAFVLDLLRMLLALSAWISHKAPGTWRFSPEALFYVAIVVALGIGTYAYFEALNVTTEHLTIETSKISQKQGRLRIVQISDVHLGLIVRDGRLENILRKVAAAKPDILVSTGDLVDGQIDNISHMADRFRQINPRYGKFAVTGNHEFHAGITHALAFAKAAGFTLLRGEKVDIPGVITIAGVDDPSGRRNGSPENATEARLLSGLSKDRFILLLKHRPIFEKEDTGHFDLQLSGHTHKGQIFPFSLIIKEMYPIDAGLLDLKNGSLLYVNRGSGTWGPPLRFFSPPEVTIIDLVHKKGKKPNRIRLKNRENNVHARFEISRNCHRRFSAFLPVRIFPGLHRVAPPRGFCFP